MEPKNAEVRVGGYAAASLLLEREPKQWHAIVLIDSDKQVTDFVEGHTLSNFVLRFDDVEGPRPKQVPPTVRQIAQALEFARGKDKLLVSCRAGRGGAWRSRTSPSVASGASRRRSRSLTRRATARTASS